jgi:hypothetical protein
VVLHVALGRLRRLSVACPAAALSQGDVVDHTYVREAAVRGLPGCDPIAIPRRRPSRARPARSVRGLPGHGPIAALRGASPRPSARPQLCGLPGRGPIVGGTACRIRLRCPVWLATGLIKSAGIDSDGKVDRVRCLPARCPVPARSRPSPSPPPSSCRRPARLWPHRRSVGHPRLKPRWQPCPAASPSQGLPRSPIGVVVADVRGLPNLGTIAAASAKRRLPGAWSVRFTAPSWCACAYLLRAVNQTCPSPARPGPHRSYFPVIPEDGDGELSAAYRATVPWQVWHPVHRRQEVGPSPTSQAAAP